ncbi:MAG: TIGR03013 family PEP-CTERM/XrtA system glycosyltransferase [Planctomycetes bacterium]|nr:TIGR03013 family PEP-CTERM/XrtA system glycosyltransferase [Planctomycetota bacterium]
MIRIFRYYISYRMILLVVSETILLATAVMIGTSAHLLFAEADPRHAGDLRSAATSSLFIALLCQVAMGFNELYEWRVSTNPRERSWKLAVACGASLISLAGLIGVLRLLGWEVLLGFAPVSGTWSLTERVILSIAAGFALLWPYRWLFHWLVVRWKFGERLLILGGGAQAQEIAQALMDRPDSGYEFLSLVYPAPPYVPFDGSAASAPGTAVLPAVFADVGELYDMAMLLRVNRVVIAMEDRRGNLPTGELLKIRMAGVKIEEREELYERITGKISVSSLRPSYLIFSRGFERSRLTFAGKRFLDLAVSLLGFVLALPVMLITAIAVKLDSRGPIFFRQERCGKDGRPFTLYKFRSMRVDAELASGPVWARTGDSRVTRIGRFIRRTRIDEIPQIFNVLRGDMSFVGPRPERPFFVRELAEAIPYYKQRLTVKPGITGWAQICYPYGSSVEDAVQKLQYDLYYIKNLSILFDLSIIMRTIKVVVLRKGAV